MKKRFRIMSAAFLLCLLLFLSGCTIPAVNWSPGRKIVVSDGRYKLTDQDVLLVALQYKCEFESFYGELLGEGFWDLPVTDELNFEQYVKEYYIFEECRTLMYLMHAADDRNVTLNYDEKQMLREAAEKFYAGLGEDEIRYSHADEESVLQLLSKYYLANKTIQSLFGDKRPEISEEESRVADIQVLHAPDRESAELLAGRIAAGEDFLTVARESTIDTSISYSVSKEELVPALRDLIFTMKSGEVSEAVELGGQFFIFRMIDPYNQLLSGKNERNLLALRRFDAWKQIYEEYESELTIERNANEWKQLNLQKTGTFHSTSLFEAF